MKLPYDMRPSTLKERQEFYQSFDLTDTLDWTNGERVYAVIIGRHSNIYPAEYKDDKNIPLIIDNYNKLNDVTQKIRQFLPEGVYYDRNHYKDRSKCHSYNLRKAWDWKNFTGQELAFDIDPENVTCPEHGTLQERMQKGWGLSFCKQAFEITKDHTAQLYEKLTQTYSHVKIVFSGRGFHIHVFDKQAQKLSRSQRKKLAEHYHQYSIDKWVTTGEMRLIRLPYTLNGAASRIVQPLTKNKLNTYNPKKDALPSFITQKK